MLLVDTYEKYKEGYEELQLESDKIEQKAKDLKLSFSESISYTCDVVNKVSEFLHEKLEEERLNIIKNTSMKLVEDDELEMIYEDDKKRLIVDYENFEIHVEDIK